VKRNLHPGKTSPDNIGKIQAKSFFAIEIKEQNIS
jgi:hypothetical protein